MSNTYHYHHPLPITQTHHTSKRGFTIVELLIVIVVVAILAAISIVSYNGIQQRANNTAIINAASQSLKMVQAYIATTGTYPRLGGSSCITIDSGCAIDDIVGKNDMFDNNMKTVGSLPRSVPVFGSTRYGITYTYGASREYNGVSLPALIIYFLNGNSQSCGLSNVAAGWGANTFSTTGYTANDNIQGKTICLVSIPGPEAA
ncbi:MAG: prepilin-type N-terminal cleavage/methylation domain-containing protein [Candidatus Saccharimonas sp.]